MIHLVSRRKEALLGLHVTSNILGAVGLVSHGNLDGKLAGAVGGLDLLALHFSLGLSLGSLVVELDEAIAAGATIAHLDDVGGLDVVGGEELVELGIVSGEGQVGNEEGRLAEGSTLTTLLGGTGRTGRATLATSTAGTTSTARRTELASLLATGSGVTVTLLRGGIVEAGTAGSTIAIATTRATRRASLALDWRLVGKRFVSGLGNLNVHLATSNLLLVHRSHGGMGISFVLKLDEAISARATATEDNVG
jgi:hypothetical protein